MRVLALLLLSLSAFAQTTVINGWGGGGNGTVSSVGLAMPSSFCTVTGSPVASSGTLTCTYATGQTPNLILGTDASGNVGLMNLSALQFPANQTIREITMNFSGGGSAIAASITQCTHVDYAGAIQAATIIADVSGSAVVDVKTVAYASYTGPASAASIAASAKPTLSSAIKAQDSTLTGWTKTLAANTEVCFALTGASTVSWVQVALKVAVN
jgi:hypothetical protein